MTLLKHLNDLLNIDDPNLEQMVGQIYPMEFQSNKANSFDTESLFLNLDLSMSNDIVSSKMYDITNRMILIFEIVYFPFLGGDVPRSPSYGTYISQLIRFTFVRMLVT